MKRILLLAAALLLVFVGMSARTFVLVAGVSNYGNEDMNLNQTTKDAKTFKNVMETQTKDITLLTSKYANKANILEKLTAICNRAQKDDTIIFYFSGHGTPGAFVASDDLISYEELTSKLDTSAAKLKVCFIDACHAGSAASPLKAARGITQLARDKKDQVFFVGCRGDEYSFESAWVGAGFFTQALVKGIRGKSDSNGDKKITVLELFKYVHNDVKKRSQDRQHPQLICPKELHNAVVANWK